MKGFSINLIGPNNKVVEKMTMKRITKKKRLLLRDE